MKKDNAWKIRRLVISEKICKAMSMQFILKRFHQVSLCITFIISMQFLACQANYKKHSTQAPGALDYSQPIRHIAKKGSQKSTQSYVHIIRAVAQLEIRLNAINSEMVLQFDAILGRTTAVLERIYNSHYRNGVPAMFTYQCCPAER